MTLTLAGAGHEPLLVHSPASGGPCAWVIMVHAPGENRTGNNYWQARTAEALAESGFTAVRFDLSGYGESLGDKDAAIWSEQITAAVRAAAAAGATDIYVTARGLHCALLDSAGASARRIALFPPDAAALGWWRSHQAAFGAGRVEVSWPMDEEQRAFWEACGAEPNVTGGLEIPVAVMDWLTAGITNGESWDLVITSADGDRSPRPARLVCGRDPLTRLESDRAGLGHLLIRWLRGPLNRLGAAS